MWCRCHEVVNSNNNRSERCICKKEKDHNVVDD